MDSVCRALLGAGPGCAPSRCVCAAVGLQEAEGDGLSRSNSAWSPPSSILKASAERGSQVCVQRATTGQTGSL
eukprot:8210901-Lingulodinium_polyedra.AAC.1